MGRRMTTYVVVDFRIADREALESACQPGRPAAQTLPGANALWVVRAGRSLRNSLFFSVFALHVAAFGHVPTESSEGEKSCDAGK
jgi:hypothetical protein